MKVFKTTISVILTIILFVLIIGLSVLAAVQGTLKVNTPVANIIVTNVYAENDLSSADLLNIQNLSKDEIHGYLDSYLKDNDIPSESLDYVLASGEYKSVISNYVSSYQSYLAGTGTKPSIPTDRINELITTGVTKYNEETGSNVNVEKVTSTITDSVKEVEKELDKVGENQYVKTAMKIVYNENLQMYLILAIVAIIAIIALINWNVIGALPYVFSANIISGLALTIVKFVLPVSLITDKISFLSGAINGIMDKILIYGISNIGIAIVLIIVFIIFKPKKKLEKKDKEI